MKFDLRILQIIFLSVFLFYGIEYLQWDITYPKVAVIVIFALVTQSLFCLAFNIPINTLLSGIITSLGLAIILRTNHLFIFGLAGFFAISSKYIFRYNNKHFFNPANFGVIFIILFTGVGWISPSQWGSSTISLFILGSMGLLVLSNLKKIDLALFFILFYYSMDFGWNILYKNWPLDFFWHNISNGSLILFTFFMITDPSSTPNTRIGRLVWVFLISILAFYLNFFEYLRGAPLYALFVLGPLVPIIDKIFSGESRFSWDSLDTKKMYSNDPASPLV